MKYKKIILGALLILLFVSITALNNYSEGHEGHDDAPASTTGAPIGDPFFVSKPTQFILGIKTEVAVKRQLNITIQSNGKITPTAKGKAEIFSSLPGKIVQGYIPVIGMSVSRGRTLLRIEQTLAIQDKLSIANEKFKAEAEYEQALKDFERFKQLEGITAQKDLLAAEIKLNASEKILDYYEEMLSGKNIVNNYFNITSPINGVIVESNISAGEQIDPSKKLLTIIDINNLWVEADIYESDISRLQNLSKANITVQTYPNEIFEGKLVNIGSVVDEKYRTVKVIFLINNKKKLLKVGMFAEVNIETESSVEVIAVPKEAVVDIGGKNVVFLHTKPQNFKGVEVFIGRDDGKYIEIVSGIVDGDRIVTTGNYQLKANAK